MLRDTGPITQALLGSLFTWSVTAVGAALVFFFDCKSKRLLNASLGFAAGVMTAASFWSLLQPALELSRQSIFGTQWSFVPVSLGFLFGAAFVAFAESVLKFVTRALQFIKCCAAAGSVCNENNELSQMIDKNCNVVADDNATSFKDAVADTKADLLVTARRRCVNNVERESVSRHISPVEQQQPSAVIVSSTWRHVSLLILAITVHNIPEGLAVGVGFGAVGKTASATFESARNLAIGIGVQNFPEGLAVSAPLLASGCSKWRAFFWGQLSGAVEPLSALLGAWAVHVCEPVLPAALSFAAGAMMFVVFDDLVPHAQSDAERVDGGSSSLPSWCAIAGFVVMMSLDVALS